MCGRYYIEDEILLELEKLVTDLDTRFIKKKRQDIFPAQMAPVLLWDKDKMCLASVQWGFPNFNKKGVIFNARSETALEKPLFRESLLSMRCIIPANGFYEWDKDKNKYLFTPKEGSLLYMAGFYRIFGEHSCFVILTTSANPSMKPVHERMPLLLEKQELQDWIREENKAKEILVKIPPALNKASDYIQQTLPLTIQ